MHAQQSSLNLRLQTSVPSDQLWPTLVSPSAPQFLYQAPPGAQQLTRPDFMNVPQFGHNVAANATPDVAFGVFPFCHRASHRSDDEAGHAARDIDPEEPTNMAHFDARVSSQAAPQIR